MARRNHDTSRDEETLTVDELRALMNKRPVQAKERTTNPAQNTQRMDAVLAKCRIGVAYIDILKIKNSLVFGKYNDRPQEPREVNKLLASFKKDGILAMRDATAIPIMLSGARVKTGLSLAVNFDIPNAVPQLQLKDVNDIVVASGQHRIAALKRYFEIVTGEMMHIEELCDDIAAVENLSPEHLTEFNRLRDQLDELQGIIILMGKWGIIVYDKDSVLADGDMLADHLCRNKSLPEYKETAEEVLSKILRSVRKAYNDAPEHERVATALHELWIQRDNTERQKNARLTKVLSYDLLILALALHLLPLGSHFHRRKEFQITWLSNSIDVVMGMFIQFIMFHSHILNLLASSDDFPDYATVNNMISVASSHGTGRNASIEQLAAWRAQIYNSKANTEVTIFNDVFEDVSIFVQEEFRNIPLKNVGTKDPQYVNSLDNYSHFLVSKLRSKWHLATTKSSQWNAITRFHDKVVARIAVWLTPEDFMQEAPLPLLCGHLLDIAWTSLMSNIAAFEEVSGWFEPLLLHYRMFHRNSHAMDDKSQVMFTNLRNESRISERETIEEAVFTCLWALRGTLVLRLQNNLTTMSAHKSKRKPFKDRKEVNEAFAQLGSDAQDNLQKLHTLMLARKGRGRDLTSEPQDVPGILAMHVTSWDWHTRISKNGKRDAEPLIKAVLLDLVKIRKRREGLFKDPMVAGLRTILEGVIAKHTRAVNTSEESGQIVKRKRWLWYDGAKIPPNVTPTVETVLTADCHAIHACMQSCQDMEGNDRAAIMKLVEYVEHMSIAKATSTHSLAAVNVVRGLKKLIHELEINSTRLRTRALESDDSFTYDIMDTVDVKIALTQGLEDENTNANESPVAEPKRDGQPRNLTATMIENNDRHPGSQTTFSGSGRPKPRPIAHRKNNDNTTTRTDSHDMVMDAFRSTESSPRPQSKGKERAIISPNGDRFQAFGEGDVSADQTAAGEPAELEPQIGRLTFDDNPVDTFSASETAAGAATQGETGEDGGNAVSRDDANRMFPVAAPRQEPCQNIDNDVIIPFAGTTNIQSIDQTDRSSAPIDC
ncbi:uncharacterized protein F5891DRAFT_1187843 [Suillus fuscotomentosus]|uniref:Uncharacterized protein n=1 Tax=Suillus fuscotomentosus TaxID=1912939 RepID=A0AAD4E7S6_9AGAM|nr:uncharacterized protein F5891DRAFT_1187843 [Suillus fuscotomentosus]KAG1901145.1 hypothetical protein F5891DRAFT_1187843 [Suillus fuscotomentosus]